MPTATKIVSAFTEEHVERLTGLSRHKLRYWDRTGFFVPTLASDDRRAPYSRVYSFKDVVALRVLAALQTKHGVSLQHLRQVSKKLAHLADDRWTKTTLYAFKKKVVFVDPDTQAPREVVSGQYVQRIVLKEVISATKADVAKLNERRPEQIGAVERHRLVAHNTSVIAGTRIPTSTILRFKEAGYSSKQIIEEYPGLTEEDIRAALRHEEKTAAA